MPGVVVGAPGVVGVVNVPGAGVGVVWGWIGVGDDTPGCACEPRFCVPGAGVGVGCTCGCG